MKHHKNTAAVAGFIAGLLLASSAAATTPDLAQLQDVEVISHHFTTAISNGKRMISVTEPSHGRYLVLKLSASLIGESGKFFTDDFVLSYQYKDGEETRSRCAAIGWAETDKPGDFEEFSTGDGAWLRIKGGRIYFGLVFYVEHEVESVDLYRIGVVEPLSYRLGYHNRSYSVFVSTNRGSKMLKKVEEAIRNGGYAVFSTQVLNPEESGTTIFYRERTETQAREISQRLMSQAGVIPTLRKMEMISEVDVVVWVGKSIGSN